jgi:hypothetical protein
MQRKNDASGVESQKIILIGCLSENATPYGSNP